MKTVCESMQCAGCMACMETCAAGAIEIQDKLHSYDAVIDEAKCVNCGRCHKVCPQINQPDGKKPIAWYQGWAEENIRRNSASGGFATAMIKAFISQGGVVCSCVQNNSSFVFDFAETESEAENFAGSKYIKSNPAGVYKRLKKCLANGQKVLFVGLPCQVMAVKRFVGEMHQDLLYTIDLICHGTPSPRLLESYLEDNKTVIDGVVRFRNNHMYQISIGTRTVSQPTVLDHYTMAFLDGVCFTENCYACKYANIERVGDITLGDSWNSELSQSEITKGISLALVQTEKGKQLLESAGLNLFDVDLDKAITANHQLQHPTVKPAERETFFSKLEKGVSFSNAVRACYPQKCLKQDIKALFIRCGIKKIPKV